MASLATPSSVRSPGARSRCSPSTQRKVSSVSSARGWTGRLVPLPCPAVLHGSSAAGLATGHGGIGALGFGQFGDLPSLGHHPLLWGCHSPESVRDLCWRCHRAPSPAEPQSGWVVGMSASVYVGSEHRDWKRVEEKAGAVPEERDVLDPTPALTRVILACRLPPTTR